MTCWLFLPGHQRGLGYTCERAGVRDWHHPWHLGSPPVASRFTSRGLGAEFIAGLPLCRGFLWLCVLCGPSVIWTTSYQVHCPQREDALEKAGTTPFMPSSLPRALEEQVLPDILKQSFEFWIDKLSVLSKDYFFNCWQRGKKPPGKSHCGVGWENARNDRKQDFTFHPSAPLEAKQPQCITSSFSGPGGHPAIAGVAH